MMCQPFADFPFRLFHQRSHWQAINQAARPLRIIELNTIPKPGEDDCGGLAEAGWDVDELRAAAGAAPKPLFLVAGLKVLSTSQTPLVIIWRPFLSHRSLKELVEVHWLLSQVPGLYFDFRFSAGSLWLADA